MYLLNLYIFFSLNLFLKLFLKKIVFYSWFYYDFHYVLAEINNNFLFIIYKTIIGIDILIIIYRFGNNDTYYILSRICEQLSISFLIFS